MVKRKKQPKFCKDGMEPNRCGIFSFLADQWIEMGNEDGSPRSGSSLGRHLSTTKQAISRQAVCNWRNGTGGKQPPWHLLMQLCDELGYIVLQSPEKTDIIPVEQAQAVLEAS